MNLSDVSITLSQEESDGKLRAERCFGSERRKIITSNILGSLGKLFTSHFIDFFRQAIKVELEKWNLYNRT